MIEFLALVISFIFMFFVTQGFILSIKEMIDDYRSEKNLEKGSISPMAIHSAMRGRKGSISQRKAGDFGIGENPDFVPEADEEKNDQS